MLNITATDGLLYLETIIDDHTHMNSSRVNGDDIPQKKGSGCAVFPTCNIWDIQSKISCELKFISSGHFPAGLILSGWVNQELDDQLKTCRFESRKNPPAIQRNSPIPPSSGGARSR